MITTDSILKAWHDYLERSPERDRLSTLRWWMENKPDLWRQFKRKPGRYAALIERVENETIPNGSSRSCSSSWEGIGMSKPKTGAMGERFWCMGCQLERPIAMLVKIKRYTKGKTIPMYRCSRCQNKKRPLKGV